MPPPKDPEKRALWNLRRSLATKGRKPSEGTIKALAATHARLKGTKQSAEFIEKRIAPLRGKPRSAEIRLKISNSHKARRVLLNKPLYVSENLKWIKEVKERDNYTCQDEGPHKGRLHAHHIKDANEYPELRYEISNGITLCSSCHNRKHHKNVRHISIFELKKLTSLLDIPETSRIENIIEAVRKLKER